MNITHNLFAKQPFRLAISVATTAVTAFVLAMPTSIHAATGVHAVVKSDAGQFVSLNGYNLTAPPGWTKNTSGMMGMDVAFLLPPKNRFAVNIIVLPTSLPPGYTISRVASEWVAQHKPLQASYAQVSHGFSTVGGLPAYRSVETSQTGSPAYTIKAEEYGVLYKGRLFQFVYTALPPDYATHLGAFETMIRTVHWQ